LGQKGQATAKYSVFAICGKKNLGKKTQEKKADPKYTQTESIAEKA